MKELWLYLRRRFFCKAMKELWLYLRRRFFCRHKMEFVEGSEWYFHTKCSKCGYEWGAGNFKIKDNE